MALVYAAYAVNPAHGQVEQIRVVSESQKTVSQQWTGKRYATAREADKDVGRINGDPSLRAALIGIADVKVSR